MFRAVLLTVFGGGLVLAADCGSAAALREQAARAYAGGDLPAAIAGLREAKAKCPAEPFLVFMLANALYRRGDLAASKQNYAEFVERRPSHIEARMCLGFVLMETGETSKAVQEWWETVRQSPESPFAHAALAVGLWSMRDRENAAIQYQVATTIDERYRKSEALAIDIRWKPEARAALDQIAAYVSSAGKN